MKKLILAQALLMLSIFTAQVQAEGSAVEQFNIHVGLAVSTCTGQGATCNVNQTTNAIGQPAHIPVTNIKEDLGKISAEETKQLEVPMQADTPIIYSFTPSEGELAGKEVYLAFENVKPRFGSRYAGQVVIKLYRNITQNPDEWLEVGNVRALPGKLTAGQTLPFIFKPNGTVSTFDASSRKEKSFLLGQEKLV